MTFIRYKLRVLLPYNKEQDNKKTNKASHVWRSLYYSNIF